MMIREGIEGMEDLCTGWNPRRGIVSIIALIFGGSFLEFE